MAPSLSAELYGPTISDVSISGRTQPRTGQRPSREPAVQESPARERRVGTRRIESRKGRDLTPPRCRRALAFAPYVEGPSLTGLPHPTTTTWPPSAALSCT